MSKASIVERVARSLERMVRRINRRHYNASAHASVCAAYAAGVINSKQMHDILGRWNRAVWPEWTKPKPKWVCSNCGNIEDKEREIMCWQCGKGEMLYTPNKLKNEMNVLEEDINE